MGKGRTATNSAQQGDSGHRKQAGRRPKTERDWKPTFLAALALRGDVQEACERAGIHRSLAYSTRVTNPTFADHWSCAKAAVADRLESEAFRRAVEGTRRPIYQGGKKVGEERKYSDTLLMFLLKRACPQKYQDAPLVERLSEAEAATWTGEMCEAYQEGLSLHLVRKMGKLQREESASPRRQEPDEKPPTSGGTPPPSGSTVLPALCQSSGNDGGASRSGDGEQLSGEQSRVPRNPSGSETCGTCAHFNKDHYGAVGREVGTGWCTAQEMAMCDGSICVKWKPLDGGANRAGGRETPPSVAEPSSAKAGPKPAPGAQ